MKALDWIISPLDVDEFVKVYASCKAVHIKSDTNKYRDFFNLNDLNYILNNTFNIIKSIRMFKESKRLHIINSSQIAENLEDGATLIVENINHLNPNISQLVDSVSAQVNERCYVNMYLSQPNEKGFGTHYDPEDVYILQLDGEKTWNVYDKDKRSSYLPDEYSMQFKPNYDNAYLNCTLKPGDTLYIPRGHWHNAIANKGYSMHLTFGIATKTPIDYFNFFVNNILTQFEEFKMPYELLVGSNNEMRVKIIEEHTKLITNLVAQHLISSKSIQSFIDYTTFNLGNNSPIQLSNLLGDLSVDMEASFYIRTIPYRLYTKKETLVLILPGKELTFPFFYKETVESIFECKSFLIKDLSIGTLTEDEFKNLIKTLLCEGIICSKIKPA